MFHTHNGWTFGRVDGGNVRIRHTSPGGSVLDEHTMTAEAWDSVVAALAPKSAALETAPTPAPEPRKGRK